MTELMALGGPSTSDAVARTQPCSNVIQPFSSTEITEQMLCSKEGIAIT
jgi:hypothetical protein